MLIQINNLTLFLRSNKSIEVTTFDFDKIEDNDENYYEINDLNVGYTTKNIRFKKLALDLLNYSEYIQ